MREEFQERENTRQEQRGTTAYLNAAFNRFKSLPISMNEDELVAAMKEYKRFIIEQMKREDERQQPAKRAL